VVGSIVNGIMFLLVTYSYVTSSALPFIVNLSTDLLNIGLHQYVITTGETFSCCKLYMCL